MPEVQFDDGCPESPTALAEIIETEDSSPAARHHGTGVLQLLAVLDHHPQEIFAMPESHQLRQGMHVPIVVVSVIKNLACAVFNELKEPVIQFLTVADRLKDFQHVQRDPLDVVNFEAAVVVAINHVLLSPMIGDFRVERLELG
jgi:hypothetical protein